MGRPENQFPPSAGRSGIVRDGEIIASVAPASEDGTQASAWSRFWASVAPVPANVAPLTGITAFLYGLLPGIGGSAVTVLSVFSASWCLLYLIVNRGVPRPALSRQHRLLMAGFASFALITLVSGLVRRNPWGGFLRAVNDFQFLYSLIPLAVLARIGPVDVRRPLGRGAAIGAMLSVLVGLLQFTVFDDPMFRPSGGTGNSALFGQACFVQAFFSMLCFPRETARWRGICLTGCVCGLVAIVLSGSRASALAASVCLMVLVGYFLAAGERAILRRGLAFVLAGLIGLSVSYPLWKNSEPAARFGNLVQRLNVSRRSEKAVESIDTRFIQIRAATLAVWRRPWLGYGMQHRMEAARKLEPPENASVFQYTHIHFLYLDYATGNGVIGLAALFIVLGLPTLVAFPRRSPGSTERIYGGLILSCGFATLGLAGACIGMDIGNTMFACFTTFLAMPGDAAALAAAQPVDTPELAAPQVEIRRAA